MSKEDCGLSSWAVKHGDGIVRSTSAIVIDYNDHMPLYNANRFEHIHVEELKKGVKGLLRCV